MSRYRSEKIPSTGPSAALFLIKRKKRRQKKERDTYRSEHKRAEDKHKSVYGVEYPVNPVKCIAISWHKEDTLGSLWEVGRRSTRRTPKAALGGWHEEKDSETALGDGHALGS